jgi:hypothetical protein
LGLSVFVKHLVKKKVKGTETSKFFWLSRFCSLPLGKKKHKVKGTEISKVIWLSRFHSLPSGKKQLKG